MTLLNPTVLSDKTEAWRTLGFDYAVRGLLVPDDAPAAFREGYHERAARSRGIRLDRFERKWLHLRFSALRRGVILQPDVTPEFLKKIDVPICPVTLVTLTHGTRTDTDWSIDRLNNDGAYARENLAVMSARANTAKGNKGFEEVYSLGLAEADTEGLTSREWYRLAILMAGPCRASKGRGGYILRLATKLPPYIVRYPELQAQHVIHLAARKWAEEKIVLRRMRRVCADARFMDTLRLLIDMVKRHRAKVTYEYDVWLRDDVFDRFRKWVNSTPSDRAVELQRALRELGGGHRALASEVEAWSLNSRGRLEG